MPTSRKTTGKTVSPRQRQRQVAQTANQPIQNQQADAVKRPSRQADMPKPSKQDPRMRRRRSPFTPQQQKSINSARNWAVRIFAGIMGLGLVVGLMFFARPATSEIEKRPLSTIAPLTLDSFLDGSFLESVSTWYADTYPLREVLVSMSRGIQSFYGIEGSVMEIGGETRTSDDLDAASKNGPSAEELAAQASKKQVDPPQAEAMTGDVQNNILNGLYVENGAAYSKYYFLEDSVKNYCSALNLAAERLDGITNVYSIVIPNNSGAMLPEETLKQFGGSNQQQAIQYFHSLMSDKVKAIETYDTLRAHNNEYLYFRTDHHWTQLAAYYIFKNFCTVKGITPMEMSTFETLKLEPFLGSFYSELGLESMANNPDYVLAYKPKGTNDMVFWDDNNNEVQYEVVKDVSGWAPSSMYSTYIAGDRKLCRIDNPEKTDGSSCLFVKDSYGCAFAPWLVDMYQTVWITDIRYTEENLVDFCKKNNITDLIVLNNMTIATTESVSEAFLYEVQEQ